MEQTPSGLYVPNGRANFKKAPPPKKGEAFGAGWAGADMHYFTLPGGGVMQFDLSRLTLADFRSMRDHYQINASLSVLSFMIHQAEWQIKCEDKAIASATEEAIVPVWSRLVRANSQAYWAGYAPTIIQWENDLQGRRTIPTKFKDLVPEYCEVNWKVINGWAPPGGAKPKIKIFDGIKIHGQQHPIPVDCSLWYPLLMENGDMYGKKLLRPAFPSWFFSILIHLFANRYFERFGEPVPIGRADFEEKVLVNGEEVSGRDAMLNMLMGIRNRSAVVLPSTRNPIGNGDKSEYAFDVEYLESQMRGADFERYLDRLDEEMSIGLFTPVLLLRTADVGSYNLGVGHMQMYMWMLNALLADFAEYINRFVIERFKAINFSPKAPRCELVFKPMGKQDGETMRAIVSALIGGGTLKPDVEELGQAIGMTLKEVKVVTEPPPDPDDPANKPGDPKDKQGSNDPKRTGPRKVDEPRATTKKIAARLSDQVGRAYREGSLEQAELAMGFRGAFRAALEEEGADPQTARELTDRVYALGDNWLKNAPTLAPGNMPTASAFMREFETMLERRVEELAAL